MGRPVSLYLFRRDAQRSAEPAQVDEVPFLLVPLASRLRQVLYLISQTHLTKYIKMTYDIACELCDNDYSYHDIYLLVRWRVGGRVRRRHVRPPAAATTRGSPGLGTVDGSLRLVVGRHGQKVVLYKDGSK